MIAPILARRDAAGSWLAVLLTGLGTGLGAAALTGLLELVQHTLWSGAGVDLLQAALNAPWWRHVAVLLGAGLLTGAGQLLLVQLSSSNGIDITAAIWFHAGRLPAVRTLGSAVVRHVTDIAVSPAVNSARCVGSRSPTVQLQRETTSDRLARSSCLSKR